MLIRKVIASVEAVSSCLERAADRLPGSTHVAVVCRMLNSYPLEKPATVTSFTWPYVIAAWVGGRLKAWFMLSTCEVMHITYIYRSAKKKFVLDNWSLAKNLADKSNHLQIIQTSLSAPRTPVASSQAHSPGRWLQKVWQLKSGRHILCLLSILNSFEVATSARKP